MKIEVQFTLNNEQRLNCMNRSVSTDVNFQNILALFCPPSPLLSEFVRATPEFHRVYLGPSLFIKF